MQGFWSNRRVLITGHTGFKGSWLALLLARKGAKVTGVALPPNSDPNLFSAAKLHEIIDSYYCDIRDDKALQTIVQKIKPEIVFHLAAQPLVRASYRQPVETFSTNVMGTVNLLESLRGLESVAAAVMVTTDKVYRNIEQPYPYRENDPLGGHDPYSASKAACEHVIASYRDSFLKEQGVRVASARAGNVIGGGDWSEDRLIPDAIRAWELDRVLDIRSPDAIRPWQHVLEPLTGYVCLAEQMIDSKALDGAYNFGPHTHEAATVQRVIDLAAQQWLGAAKVNYSDNKGPHEAGWLALETAKARTLLNCHPCWALEDTVARTINWYAQFNQGKDARTLCDTDILTYESALERLNP